MADIDHYDERKDFTIDPIKWANMSEYFGELHSLGMKTVNYYYLSIIFITQVQKIYKLKGNDIGSSTSC